MSKTSWLLGRSLLVASATFGTLFAQETGFSTDLKARSGYSFGAKDQLRANSLGFGLNFAYGTSIGKVSAELGYYRQAGDRYVIPVQGSAPSNLQAVDPANSGDSRQNSLDGFAVRLAISNVINTTWDWQAGLMIGGTRFKHEYVGDVRSQNWTVGTSNSWRDTYSGTPTSHTAQISPFAGVTWKLDDDSAFEFNVLLARYQALEYIHTPGTATHGYELPQPNDSQVGPICTHNDFASDVLHKTNRLVPQIELGYVFHF